MPLTIIKLGYSYTKDEKFCYDFDSKWSEVFLDECYCYRCYYIKDTIVIVPRVGPFIWQIVLLIHVDMLLIRYTSALMVCYIINYHTPGLAGTVILTADVGTE